MGHPPEYICIDLRCRGSTGNPTQSAGHLIVYGIEGKQNDVASDVYDALFVVDKGKMVMQTDLALNTHHIRGVDVYENGKTSVYHHFFVSFINFRLPDTHNLVNDGGNFSLSLKDEKRRHLTKYKKIPFCKIFW